MIAAFAHFLGDAWDRVLDIRIRNPFGLQGTAAAFLKCLTAVLACEAKYADAHAVCLDLQFAALQDPLDHLRRILANGRGAADEVRAVPFRIIAVVNRKIVFISAPFPLLMSPRPGLDQIALFIKDLYLGRRRADGYFMVDVGLIYAIIL